MVHRELRKVHRGALSREQEVSQSGLNITSVPIVFVAQPCPTLCDPHGLYPARVLCPWNFLGKSTGVGCHSLLQEIFPTQRSNPGLLHCRQIFLPSEPLGSYLTLLASDAASVLIALRLGNACSNLCLHLHMDFPLCLCLHMVSSLSKYPSS